MPIVQVQAVGNSGTGTTGTCAFTSNVTAGNFIVAHVSSAVAAITPTDTRGHTYLASQAESVVNTNNRTRLYYVANITGGANTVQVTFGSSSKWILNIAEYSGIKTTSPLLQVNAGTGFGTAANSGNITITVADTMLLGSGTIENSAGDPITPGTNWGEVLNTATGANTPATGYLEARLTSATGTYDATATLASSTNWAWQIAAFEAATVPGRARAWVGYFDSPTSLQAQSVSGLGFTPKIVYFFGANHGIGGTDQDDHHKFMGVAVSSSAQQAAGCEPLHNVSPSDGAVAHSNAHCLYVPDATGTRILDATFTRMDADGFTVNWTDVWTSPIRVYFLALGGTTLQVACGHAQALTTIGMQDITTPGFQPDAVWCWECLGSSTMPITQALFATSGCVGFGTSSAAQGVSGWRSNISANPQRCSTLQLTNKIVTFPNIVGSAIFREAGLDSMLTTGFRLNWTTVNATAAYYFWVALKGVSFKVGTFTATPGAGNLQAVTLGFVPSAVFLTSGNKATTGVAAAHFRTSWGATDGTNKFSIWGGERDNAATTISATRADIDRVFRMGAENATGPSCDTECAIDTLIRTSDGFSVHYDVTTTTGQEIVYFAVGPFEGLDQYGFRFRNDDGTEATATWKAAQDTTITLAEDEAARLRVLINSSGDVAGKQLTLGVKKVGAGNPIRNIDQFQ